MQGRANRRWSGFRRRLISRYKQLKYRRVPPVRTLADEIAFEAVEELERQLIFRRQGLLTNDRLHRRGITTDSVFGVLCER
jgi:hypothetical protein